MTVAMALIHNLAIALMQVHQFCSRFVEFHVALIPPGVHGPQLRGEFGDAMSLLRVLSMLISWGDP